MIMLLITPVSLGLNSNLVTLAPATAETNVGQNNNARNTFCPFFIRKIKKAKISPKPLLNNVMTTVHTNVLPSALKNVSS